MVVFFCFLGEHFSGAALEIQRSNQPGAQDRGLSQQKQPICEKITGILGANQEIKCSTGAPHWGIKGLIAAALTKWRPLRTPQCRRGHLVGTARESGILTQGVSKPQFPYPCIIYEHPPMSDPTNSLSLPTHRIANLQKQIGSFRHGDGAQWRGVTEAGKGKSSSSSKTALKRRYP